MTDPSTAIDEHLDTALRPRARDWFWHPWYAKLWWGVAGMIWIGSFLPLPQLILSEHSYLVAAALFLCCPYLIIFCLGFGYFTRAWKYRWSSDPVGRSGGSEEARFVTEKRYPLSGGMDPTNPNDSDWFWHPSNPMSDAFQRRAHGKH